MLRGLLSTMVFTAVVSGGDAFGEKPKFDERSVVELYNKMHDEYCAKEGRETSEICIIREKEKMGATEPEVQDHGQFEKDVAEMFGEFCTIANYNTFPCIRWRIIKDEETKNGAADAEDVDKRMREELAKLSKEHEL